MTTPLITAKPEDEGVSSDGLARIDELLAKFVAQDELPGAVVIAARCGKVIHRGSTGFSNLQTRAPLAQDAIFRIFSMTKPVTAVAMMILHEQGKWRPEDSLADHLPEFAAVLGPDGQLPSPAPTMLHLMTHMAGFGYGIGLGPFDTVDSGYIAAGIWEAENLADMARRVASVPLAYQPGSSWRYSLSMDLQGAIIEKLSGETLPDFMRAHIFAPLGMQDTDFYVPHAKLGRLVTAYHKYFTPALAVVDHPSFMRDGVAIPKIPSGGGGLFSTAADYARFAQMLLNQGTLDGATVLRPESVALMTQNHVPPALIERGFKAGFQRIGPGIGYGFNGAVYFDPAAAGAKVGRGTYQWDGAGGTWFWIDPENQLLFVGMVQRMLQEGMPALQRLTQEIIGQAIK